jgi:hypothetical protein
MQRLILLYIIQHDFFLYERSLGENCRGITPLCSLSKIYENILRNTLTFNAQSILMQEQTGFCKGRSFADSVFTLQCIIDKRKEFVSTFLLFIDFKEACDRSH